jgi:hypothetical protein
MNSARKQDRLPMSHTGTLDFDFSFHVPIEKYGGSPDVPIPLRFYGFVSRPSFRFVW